MLTWHENYRQKIRDLAKKYGDKNAFVNLREEGTTTNTTFPEVLNGCEHVEKLLESIGVVAGDRVAVISPHSTQAVLVTLSLAYANVTAVLIDASLPKSEINRLLLFADVRAIFTTAKIHADLDATAKRVPIYELCGEERKYVRFEDSAVNVQVEDTIDREKDVIAILFSSGTTAQMKGIKVTYESAIKSAEIFVRNVKWNAEYSYLHVFPLNHIAGFATIHAFYFCGCEQGMIENMTSTKLLDALRTYEPYGFGMIPKVFEMMEDKIRERIHQKGKVAEGLVNMLLTFSGFLRKSFGINVGKYIFPFITKEVFGRNIKAIGTGATLCRKSTSKFFIDMGLLWANFYAATETNVAVASTGAYDKYPVLMAGNAKRNPEIEIRIHNPNSDGIGEIYVKSQLLMKGYFREEELTKNSFDGEFFKMGDYGYINSQGNLFVTGRVKEAILLHNGKKISPTDIENYYKSIVDNIEFACCGCAKEGSNYDEVYLFAQTAGMDAATVEQAVFKLQEASARASDLYKIDYVRTIEKLPLTTVGKVKRFELQKVAMQERELLSKEDIQDIGEEDIDQTVIQTVQRVAGKGDWSDNRVGLRDELGIDSLGLFELQTELERAFGRRISIDWEQIVSLQDLIDAVKNADGFVESNMEDEKYLLGRSVKDIRRIKRLIKLFDKICAVEYKGLENLPDEPCIIAANHSSHLDMLCIYKALILQFGYEKVNTVCCLAAKELAQVTTLKKVFYSLGAIPVDRKGDTTRAFSVLNKYIKEKGYSAVVFPEGTRTRTGKMGVFTNGVASAAIQNSVPIIPVGIKGTFDIWPATRKIPKLSFKRKQVVVKIGEPIYPVNEDMNGLTDYLKRTIEEMHGEK